MVAQTHPAAGPNMRGSDTSGGTRQSQSRNARNGFVPFVRASAEHTESTGYDVSTLMTTSTQTLPDITVPAYGFLRSVLLVVTTTGSAGAAVFAEDGPFNALSNVVLQEPNGAQICNFPSGYDLYLANKFGGYRFINDPRSSDNFSASTGDGSFSYVLRVPVEINNRDGLGALPNQNSGALFRIKLNLAAAATVYGTPPATTNPTVRVRAYAEEWDQPEDSTDGVANQTVPPAVNTTQYWSRQDFPVNAGTANIRLTRMGNYIRNLVFVFRDSTGRVSGDGDFPDPATLYYDTRPLDTQSRAQWLERNSQNYDYNGTPNAAGGRESGVWAYDFCHEFDGRVGHENRSLWLPTWSSTRFEIGGQWGAAGTLSVLTNDVTIADNVWAPGA